MAKLFEDDFPIRIRYFHDAKRIKSDFEVQTKKIHFHLQSTPNIIFACLKKEGLRRQIYLATFPRLGNHLCKCLQHIDCSL